MAVEFQTGCWDTEQSCASRFVCMQPGVCHRCHCQDSSSTNKTTQDVLWKLPAAFVFLYTTCKRSSFKETSLCDIHKASVNQPFQVLIGVFFGMISFWDVTVLMGHGKAPRRRLGIQLSSGVNRSDHIGLQEHHGTNEHSTKGEQNQAWPNCRAKNIPHNGNKSCTLNLWF